MIKHIKELVKKGEDWKKEKTFQAIAMDLYNKLGIKVKNVTAG